MIQALIDHLWQSTLFALFVALLAVMVRRSGGAVRYGLWFAASGGNAGRIATTLGGVRALTTGAIA